MGSRILSFILLSFFLVSCNDPKSLISYLHKEIKGMGYLPYVTPLSDGGSGTLIGGAYNQMTLVAPPEACFSGEGLRVFDKTVFAKKTFSMMSNGNASIGLGNFLNLIGSLFQFKASFSRVKAMSLDMKNLEIEYFNSIAMVDHYRNGMSETCKDFLDHVGYISQSLRVGELHFEFLDQKGAKIDFTVNLPTTYMDFGAGVDWYVENRTSLVITTPTYIGFQLGRLLRSDNGISLYRSAKLDKKGNYAFSYIGIFQPPAPLETPNDAMSAFALNLREEVPAWQTSRERLEAQGLLSPKIKSPWQKPRAK